MSYPHYQFSRKRRGHTDPESDEEDEGAKKDKKLVFLSRSVLQKVRERPMVTGTQIANEILEMYKKFCDVSARFCANISKLTDVFG